MTRSILAYTNQMAAQAPNQSLPFGGQQQTATNHPIEAQEKLDSTSNPQFGQNYYAQTHNQQSSNQQQYHFNKGLGLSSSMLAGDNYLSGMASDSELSNSSRHHGHHRHVGYPAMPRVYHAHPLPRASHNSSRMSHYSDSAASYVSPMQSSATGAVPSTKPPMGTGVSLPSASPAHHANQVHGRALSQQASVSSSGSSVSSSVGLAGQAYPHQMMTCGETSGRQAQARPPSGGRHLPQRPLKQSMSIDHSQDQGHTYLPGVRSSNVAPSQAHHSEGSHDFSLNQQQNYPMGQQLYGQQQQRYVTSAPSRNYRSQIELMEKQVADLSFHNQEQELHHSRLVQPAYSADHQTLGEFPQTLNGTSNARIDNPSLGSSPSIASPAVTGSASRPPTSASARQLPQPINSSASGSMLPNSDQFLHHNSTSALDQQPHSQYPSDYHSNEQSYHHQGIGSNPAERMRPLALGGNHPGRSSGVPFKQAMSIDHYSTHSQQQQQLRYSPARTSGSHINDRYPSPLNYNKNSQTPNYEQGGSVFQEAHMNTQMSGLNLRAEEVRNDGIHSQHEQIYQQTRSSDDFGLRQHHSQESDAGQYSQPHPRAASATSSLSRQHLNQRQRPSTLQHQASSSSSNSQSGSLRSSYVDIQKASSGLLTQDQQQLNNHQQAKRANMHMHFQSPQQKSTNYRHGGLRKGYTSATSGYSEANVGGSSLTLSESGDLSSSQATTHSGHLTSQHGYNKRVLRAASPLVSPGDSLTGAANVQPQISGNQRDTSCVGGGTRSESSTGLPNAPIGNNSSLTKKSNSATQLSMTGTKKRLGFRKKQVTSFSVHRSEEVAPYEVRHLVKQGSSVSEAESSMSGDSSSRSWSNSNFKQPTPDEMASMSFIDGLGKGQMISRQGLASPYLGDLQLSLCDRRGNLEVEVIRARQLQAKANKILPLTYVKLYLVKNRKCLAKAKTMLSNKRTLDPLFQQQLTFHEDYHGCILQSIVWGNFGKMDKKNFMGIAQISIDDLELSDTVISWYKLFLPGSLQTLPSKSLRHTLLSNSTESFTNTNNS